MFVLQSKSAIAAAAVACAVALSGLSQPVAAETTLTVSSWVPPTHFLHTQILVPYGEQIAKVTEGRVKIRILPAALGSPPQHFELARKGAADITWGNFTYEPDRFVSMWFAEFPFAGTNAEAASVALWRVYDKHLKSNVAYEGVKMLGVGLLGGGQIHHGKKTVVNPDDLANQKVRMGGPIQKRMLEALGSVPVAAPGPKAYELLQSGVIDASLHSMESVVNFRLEDSLKHHTVVPDGFYDATFFIAINGRKWDALDAKDRAAIEKISGEALSAEWGRQFDKQNEAAIAKLKAAGHTFADASPALITKIRAVNDGMIKDWTESAKKAGVADPAAVLADYHAAYKSLAKK